MSANIRIVAGWGDRTRVYPSLRSVMVAHGEVFGAPMMDPKTLEKMGVRLEYALDDDGELVYRIAGGLTYAQARALVDYANSEGNYDEFVFRPAWPDEV